MDTPLAQQLALSTFTPSTMPPTVLEGMFVQREQLLQSIVQELAASVDDTKKFLMLVGARGMGKTHLVSLVYHRLKQKPELGEKLLIAWLREEEYGVNSWLYLIVEILRSLGLEEVETEAQITKLANLPIGDAEYLADRVLQEVIGDRTLLIITENIDKLLFGLGEKEQWKFRAFLQETNCCSILATTPKISQDTGRKEKPFFGFFTPIHLPILTHVDAVAMLINIANLSGNSGLVKFLETVEGQSRVRALHHLAGGNPRVYALFAQLVTEESLEALLPAVLEMLDKLTPYYQSRVESLGQSDDQQKIVMYLTRETRAVTVKEITAQCFISSDRTTSNALKKLKEKGYVVSTQKGREVFYEISEVLMRLCLEMKNARSGDLKLCVDFLRIWYRPKELLNHLDKLELAGKLDYAEYFRKSLMDSRIDPILLACQQDLRRSIDDGDTNSALSIWRELAAVNNISEPNDQRIVEMINGGKLIESIREIEVLIEKETIEELYLIASLLCDSNKWQEAIEKFESILESQPNRYAAWVKLGFVQYNLERYEQSIVSYDHAININPNDNPVWKARSLVLHELGRNEEAIINSQKAFELDSNDFYSWSFHVALLVNANRCDEAINVCNNMTTIDFDDKEVASLSTFFEGLVKYFYTSGLQAFSQGNYSDAILLWQKVFNVVRQHKIKNLGVLIVKFLNEELLQNFKKPIVHNMLPQIFAVYTSPEVLPELCEALVMNLSAIQDPKVSDYTAIEWLKMWQELGKPHPELALALKMLEAGIKYKQNPKDDRIFLSLPQEMRPILREALGLSSTNENQ